MITCKRRNPQKEQLMREELQMKLSLASYWPAKKGALLYGCAHVPWLSFWSFKLEIMLITL